MKDPSTNIIVEDTRKDYSQGHWRVENSVNVTGEVLSDVYPDGKERPWKKRKQQSLLVSGMYEAIGRVLKAYCVKDCGSFLGFIECPDGHEKKLEKANFCRERLCPMCQWRRSIALALQVRTVSHHVLRENPSFRFLFSTGPHV